jgi:hypothetical protein
MLKLLLLIVFASESQRILGFAPISHLLSRSFKVFQERRTVQENLHSEKKSLGDRFREWDRNQTGTTNSSLESFSHISTESKKTTVRKNSESNSLSEQEARQKMFDLLRSPDGEVVNPWHSVPHPKESPDIVALKKEAHTTRNFLKSSYEKVDYDSYPFIKAKVSPKIIFQ